MTDLLDIDWLDGVAYVVDPAGRIIALGRRRWDRFAAENGAPELCEADNVIGLDLLSVVRGDDVCRAYRLMIRELLRGRRDGFSFGFRCDAADTRREMRMALTPLKGRGSVSGILFQSVLLSSEMRPPLDIFRFRDLSAALGLNRDWPVVTICSWCQKVKAGDWGADPRWVTAEDYYRLGGESEVRISHGICPSCSARLRLD